LKLLPLDILLQNNNAITPKTAIEHLIRGLKLGGAQMTEGSFANAFANEAIKQFFAYFNALPSSIKAQLRALKKNGLSLGYIIDKEIDKGECVITIAGHLNSIVQGNNHQSVLIAPPHMSLAALKTLRDKYGSKNNLDTKKEDLLLPIFPNQLTRDVIKHIQLQTLEQLINLTIDFPPTFYEILWQNVRVNKPVEALNLLAKLIKKGGFNEEQQQALAIAIVKAYPHFHMKGKSILFWTLETEAPIFLKEALCSYPKEERLNALKTLSEGLTILHHAVSNPMSIQIILDLLPENQRLEAMIKVADRNGETVLHHAVNYPKSLKLMLAFFPQDLKLNAVTAVDKYDRTIMHKAADKPESLKVILDSLSKHKNLLDVIMLTDIDKGTLLQKAAGKPESLKMILELYPEHLRLGEIKHLDLYGLTVLHYAEDNSQSLKVLLDSLPKHQRLEAVNVATIYKGVYLGKTVLHYNVDKPECFKVVLKSLPKHQRLQALKAANKDGITVLYKATTEHPELLQTILALLPIEHRSEDMIMAGLTWKPNKTSTAKIISEIGVFATIPNPEEKNLAAYKIEHQIK
jgi:hypothetical protein